MNLIKKYRLIRGYTQIELSVRVGTTQSCIARWETGSRAPSVRNLAKLTIALGVPVEQLVDSIIYNK